MNEMQDGLFEERTICGSSNALQATEYIRSANVPRREDV